MKYLRGSEINIKALGDDFYEAYKRCFEGKPVSEDIMAKAHIVAIPAFVNGFLACEIYLKDLIGSRKIKGDGHNLKNLYLMLGDEYKGQLQGIQCDPRYSLDCLLDKIGDGFKVWRYIYEEGNEDFGDGRPFEYSEYFLETYLPVLERMARNKRV